MTWFAFDIDDYDADTMHLTAAEDGIYCRLLRHYYKTRTPLPDNDRALAAIARISVEDWLAVAPTIRPFFTPRKDRLHQTHCDRELEKQDQGALGRSERAQKAAKVRWAGNNELDAKSMPAVCAENAQIMLGDATEPLPLPLLPFVSKDTHGSNGAGAPIQIVTKKVNGKRLKTRIDPDYDLMPPEWEFAERLGLDPREQVEAMKDHFLSTGTMYGDWDATFRNWCRRAVKFKQQEKRRDH